MARSLIPRDSVVVIKGSPRHRRPCPSSDLSPWNFRGLCILQTQYDNYDASESRWRRQGTLATTSQIKEGICWFARTVWENLLYSSYHSTSGTRLQHKCITHAATQCTRGQQAIKTDDKKYRQTSACVVACFIDCDRQWQFIDSDNVVLDTSTYSVRWKLISLITCFYISTRQKSLKFESCFFSPRGVSHYPEMGSVVVHGDWLSDCCLRNALLWVTL